MTEKEIRNFIDKYLDYLNNLEYCRENGMHDPVEYAEAHLAVAIAIGILQSVYEKTF